MTYIKISHTKDLFTCHCYKNNRIYVNCVYVCINIDQPVEVPVEPKEPCLYILDPIIFVPPRPGNDWRSLSILYSSTNILSMVLVTAIMNVSQLTYFYCRFCVDQTTNCIIIFSIISCFIKMNVILKLNFNSKY